MEKINNIKAKFYLLKKHMRAEDFENLINIPNYSMVNSLKNKINEQNINIKEKSKDTLFTTSINQSQKKNNSDKISEKKNKIKDKEKEKYQNLINQENNNSIKTNNILNNENIEEENEKDNMSIDSSSSSSISNFNLNNEEEKKEIIPEKQNLYDKYDDYNNEDIFDDTYILDCKSDLADNIDNNNSIIDNENNNNNGIKNTNNNNEEILETNIKNQNLKLKNKILSVKNNNNESKINSNINLYKNNEKNNNPQIKTNSLKEQNQINQNKKKINDRNQIKGDKKIIKKSLITESIKSQNNFQNKQNIYQENNNTNLTINNNNNATSNKITNSNNKQIIVNQTNIIVTSTKIKIPYCLEDIESCENNYSNILENKIVEDILNINNNMNINTNNINNEVKQNNQNSNLVNNKNEHINKNNNEDNKNESSKKIPVNNKIIIDDEEENHNKKKIDNNDKCKDKNFEKTNNIKKNPLVSLEGTQVKVRFEDNQITPNKDNNSFISENSNLKKVNNQTEKINQNLPNKKIINQKIISHEHKNIIKPKTNNNHSHSHSNNHINNSNKTINHNNNFKNTFSEDIFTKKEMSSYLLSQFTLIIKTMEENFRKEYQDDYNNSLISKTIEDSLNHISELENLEISKRRKSICKEIPKLISTLFKNFEEEKRRDVILNNVNSLLESITVYFHEMKLIYLKKEGKVPPKFLQLKTIIKYIYSLFKMKSFSTKYLKDYIKNNAFSKINNFTKYYKIYQNSTDKLLHFLKKINEDHKAIKKYNNLNFYLEMNPLMIKYSKCYKQGRKMIDFFFDYFDYNSNSSEKKK